MFFPLQCYQFRKRPLPEEDDEEDQTDLAIKLAKYNVAVPKYSEAYLETCMPW